MSKSNFVFVLDAELKPLTPCTSGVARSLLKAKKAAVYRRFPFTIFNRTRLGLAKTHWLDAACVGQVETLEILTDQPLLIKATGHGTRQMCRTDKFGFPSRYVPRNKFVQGFQTGDIVQAVVVTGKKVGTYVGRVAVRSTGSFNISTAACLVQGISHKHCKAVHKKDGYNYAF